MHVENVAVYDVELGPAELSNRVTYGRKAVEAIHDHSNLPAKVSASDHARENLAQFGAVAGICNAATFAADENEKSLEVRTIIGDATGALCVGRV